LWQKCRREIKHFDLNQLKEGSEDRQIAISAGIRKFAY
jgi:hypothetical protein